MSGFVPDQDSDLEAPANLLRLLGHPMRLSICLLLLTGPRTVAFIESHLGLKQPKLSQHLAILRDAGLLAASRKAKSVTYEIAPGPVHRLLSAVAAVLAPAQPPTPAAALPPTVPEHPAATPVHPPVHTPPRVKAPDLEPRFEHEEALVFASVRYPRP